MKSATEGSWLPAQGRILSIVESCMLKATEYDILTKTRYSKELPCELVDAFKAVHADKTWSVSHIYSGAVEVERADATSTIEMSLHYIKNTPPAVGDILALRQNPADPTQVSYENRSATYPKLIAIAGAVAVPLLWLGLGAPWPRRRGVEEFDELEPVYAPSAAAPVVADVSRFRRDLPARKPFGRRGV